MRNNSKSREGGKISQEPFQPFPQCVECLMGLAQSAANLVAEQGSRFQGDAEVAASAILVEAEKRGLTSPETANLILREIKRFSGVYDPYAQLKAQEIAFARKIFSRLEGYVGDDLRSRVRLAVLGNSLDFFKTPEEALKEIPDQIRRRLSFFHDDVDALETFLSNGPGLILYLTDNAGEIYFDLPLYEYIRERTERAVLVVKGGPSLNDLTRSDLQEARLGDKFYEVADTGTDGAGVDWGRVSKKFLNLVDAADMILAKGMANFESIYTRNLTAPAFFLFKAKCRPIQEYLNAPADSKWALWKDVNPPNVSL